MRRTRLQCIQESADLRAVLGKQPPFATVGYDPANTEWDFVNVLILGAGGIGCELLHLLALSGFGSLTIIDLDTIELSNLNRQFLFREEDIGKPKSNVAARRVMERCPGVTVTGVFGRIEDQSDDFYRSFHFIVMGLDSVPARRWMNHKVAELATWRIVPQRGRRGEESEDRDPSASTSSNEEGAFLCITDAIPMVETGTEGLMGHVKFIDMAKPGGACVECMREMYETRRKQVPMCTLENIPRVPEHCVLYVQFKEWPDAHVSTNEPLDGDNVEHIRWVAERARQRQIAFGIGGNPIDETFTLGVVKNVVPAVSFTNAMVAGMAVTEIMKWLTGVAPTLDDYFLYDGSDVSTDVTLTLPGAQKLGGSATCPVCGPRRLLPISLNMTPDDIRQAMVATHAAASSGGQLNCGDVQGTLSLQYRISDNRATAVEEVFLSFKAGNPLAVPIVGATLRDILASSGDSSRVLLASWEQQQQLAVTAMLTVGRLETITFPVYCMQ